MIGTEQQLIGVFGGTFDPPHNGHRAIIEAAYRHLAFQKILLVPCRQPVLKQAAAANANQRIDMLTLLINDLSYCSIDTQELDRDTPSYMTLTLETLTSHYPDNPLVLLLGEDAFCSLPEWYHWQDIFTFAHIAVAKRAGFSHKIPSTLLTHIAEREVQEGADLLHSRAGKVYYIPEAVPLAASRDIRAMINAGSTVPVPVSAAVKQYILDKQLYLS